MNFIVIKKKNIVAILLLFLAIIGAAAWFTLKPDSVETIVDADKGVRTINMITAEFKSTTKDGKMIEAYRWDPGTIVLQKNEKVNLKIYGVNGDEHPFYIEGTNIKGTVKKGKETIVPLKFTKEGVYRIICNMHEDYAHQGPMIGYIVVD
ncbi:cupredoxin domain-containing protein [Falsibacillus albus]|uniref:EfeO-type cupredoxin-like domain-containing protein n=1 Tax=Falsibacillus albus TaxID=2478915 RepID=A0A3L7JX21_9BACI|nr:cupredoxin domain-containing protein [Falsibacillus albus]RLQ95428.1 hypothetical protein D9X91_10350 [Falsibacillus albus]